MPPRSTAPIPARLPPLSRIRLRRANKPEPNPCTGIMTSMLGCWASAGYSAQGCVMLEQALRTCMDTQVCFFVFFLNSFEGGRLRETGEKDKDGQS